VGAVAIAVADANETLGQGTDYSYTITVSGGKVSATAASPYGVAYALETLSQFLDAAATLRCTELSVEDAPAYIHRGIMIDTGRRFYPVALVKQTIEGMAMTRQNVLHFHLSEQCFRVQSSAYPQLTASCLVGKYNNTASYSRGDIAEIVSFARERGVRVLPEFDMPGEHHRLLTRPKARKDASTFRTRQPFSPVSWAAEFYSRRRLWVLQGTPAASAPRWRARA